MKISVVLPTFNEKKNISILIPKIESIIENTDEILIVDDNSPDGTAETARDLNRVYGNIRVIVRKDKMGIGSAIREGYDLAKNEIIISIDSDLSFDPEVIMELKEKIEEGYDMVVGSRHSELGGYEKSRLNTLIKNLASRTGNKIITKITGIRIHDFSANCRAIRRDTWKSIDTKEKSNFFLFETIFKVHRGGYRLMEIPVYFRDRIYGESKLNLKLEIPKFLMKLCKYILFVRK